MGSRLIFLHRRQVRRGDGALKVIRVLEIPVYERRRSTGKSVDESPDTGGRAEYAQALERTQEKELGKLTP